MPGTPSCTPRGQALTWVAFALAAFGHGACAGEVPFAALGRITSPGSLAGVFPAYFASFSAPDTPPGKLAAWALASDPMGCHSYMLPDNLPGGRPGVAVVRRGNCTFIRKAQLAERAGAEAVIIVSDSDEQMIMGAGNDTDASIGIVTLAVSKSVGDKILAWTRDHSRNDALDDQPLLMSFEIYKPSALNPSELLMILLGTALVAAGAYFSTSDLSTRGTFQQAVAAPQEEVTEVDYELAIGFFVFGSCFLVILYFFMKYLIYLIIFSFCLGGFNTLTAIGSIFLQWVCSSLKTVAVNVPQFGPITQAEILAGVPSLGMVIAWYLLRKSEYGWFFQDVIGAGFLCWLQRTLRLPNIKIASCFLSMMFFFDIFWVFISPLFFQDSVMVHVATGGETHETVPMLLRLPAIGDPFGSDRMLGFGDIALPGLLVSFLRRHDVLSHRSLFSFEGYFGPVLIGYFFGLCATIVALEIMQKGQPALLYLVPGTLGTTVVRALCKRELQYLWDGRACTAGSKAGSRSLHDGRENPSACCPGNDGL
uniref:PA domain-containing protein n=1 Tax=Alexandrium monilatum TaxID=311494 RepID=A0A7S4R2V7_9DINO